jgi:hypothetical protein
MNIPLSEGEACVVRGPEGQTAGLADFAWIERAIALNPIAIALKSHRDRALVSGLMVFPRASG